MTDWILRILDPAGEVLGGPASTSLDDTRREQEDDDVARPFRLKFPLLATLGMAMVPWRP